MSAVKSINGKLLTAIKSINGGAIATYGTTPTPITPPTVIGEACAGGYYAGKIALAGGGTATHYLIVAPKATGEFYGKTWGPTSTTTSITNVITGPANSIALALLASTYEAARWCESLEIGGYTDWYLPAKNELEVLYYNLKPGTDANNTGYGSNANAVSPEPVSTVYTAGAPAQTSATAFRTGASSQEFVEYYYWSSTEYSSNLAWLQYFGSGYQNYNNKDYTDYYCRAVRRLII